MWVRELGAAGKRRQCMLLSRSAAPLASTSPEMKDGYVAESTGQQGALKYTGASGAARRRRPGLGFFGTQDPGGRGVGTDTERAALQVLAARVPAKPLATSVRKSSQG